MSQKRSLSLEVLQHWTAQLEREVLPYLDVACEGNAGVMVELRMYPGGKVAKERIKVFPEGD